MMLVCSKWSLVVTPDPSSWCWAVKTEQSNNGIAVHAKNTHHDIQWDRAEVIGREPHWHKRKLEALWIQRTSNTMSIPSLLMILPIALETSMSHQWHLMLEGIYHRQASCFVRPVLVHQRKNFSAFNYSASTLISQLRNVCAFGSDGDPALIDAFAHNFPCAKQLRCFFHLKRNATEKLKEIGIPNAFQ